jgi:hypothetical protein
LREERKGMRREWREKGMREGMGATCFDAREDDRRIKREIID